MSLSGFSFLLVNELTKKKSRHKSQVYLRRRGNNKLIMVGVIYKYPCHLNQTKPGLFLSRQISVINFDVHKECIFLNQDVKVTN